MLPGPPPLVAPIAHHIENPIFGRRQRLHRFLEPPFDQQMDIPVGGFEQTPKAPRGDGRQPVRSRARSDREGTTRRPSQQREGDESPDELRGRREEIDALPLYGEHVQHDRS